MPLTNIKIKNAKPDTKVRRLYDERGLYIEVPPSGNKRWRFKYRFQNKEKRISLGVYPGVSLRDARKRRDSAHVAAGRDPSEERKASNARKLNASSNQFQSVATEWFEVRASGWSDSHSENVANRIERYLLPSLANRTVSEITAQELLAELRKPEGEGKIETAKRVLGIAPQIFSFAIATGRAERNVAVDLTGAIKTPKVKHLVAVTTPEEVADLMNCIHGYSGTATVNAALKIAPLLFVRPGELRHMRWEELSLEKAEWSLVTSKTATPLLVPLPNQAVEILQSLKQITGSREFVFPGARDPKRPMSNNAVLAALRRMEISKDVMSGHGFRAMARTILDEVHGVRPEIIEQQLGHQVRDPLGRAYNRTTHIAERREMMQQWADYLDELRWEK